MNLALQSKSASIGIVLATLALSALFLAQGVNAYVIAALPGADRAAKLVAAHAGPPPGTAPPDRCAILARNAFDPASGGLCPPKAVAGIEPPPAPRPGETPPPCEGQTRKLVAAVHTERDPKRSFVELVSTEAASQLLREGDRIGDNVVFAIHPTAVHLKQSNGQLCSLTMFGEPASNRPPVRAQAKERSSSITAVTGAQFTVRRALVDSVLQDPMSSLGSVRVVPHSKDGRAAGIKIYGIRSDSPLHALGLQNGDALLTINGLEIATPDAALEAYGQLRGASHLAVSLERRGQPMTVAYAIE